MPFKIDLADYEQRLRRWQRARLFKDARVIKILATATFSTPKEVEAALRRREKPLVDARRAVVDELMS